MKERLRHCGLVGLVWQRYLARSEPRASARAVLPFGGTPLGTERPLGLKAAARYRGASRAAILAVCLWASAASAENVARTAAEQLAAGNKLLAGHQYKEALAAYDKAAEALPRSAEVAYNRGIALYRLDRFAEAQSAFQDVLTRGRPELEAKAKFNLGRSAQAAAMTKADDLQAAVNDLGRSIGFYKDTLQLKPDHVAARKNMADAQRLRGFLKKIMERMPNEEQKKDGDKKDKSDAESQPDKDGQKQDSKPGDGEKDDEQQGEGEREDEQDDPGDSGDDATEDADTQPEPSTQPATQPTSQLAQEPKTQPASQPTTAPTSQPTGEQDERSIGQQEAERMLQEARDAERLRREELRRRRLRQQGRIPVDKDW